MRKRNRIVVNCIAASLAVSALVVGPAVSASASAGGPDLAEAATVRAATVAAISPTGPDALQCGWHPANDARAPGYLYNLTSTGGDIFNGPDIGCTPVGVGYNGDYVVVHCGWYNSNLGYWYDYLTDYSQGVTGWIVDDRVNWRPYGGHAQGC